MESKFLTELECREVGEGRWQLLSDLVYQSEILNGGVIAPKGFVTDFASVPRVPIAYMLFGDRAHREAVVHDYLYQRHTVKKSIADKVFLEAMKARGKKPLIRWAMYAGVVLGGRSSYKSGPSRYLVMNPDDPRPGVVGGNGNVNAV